MMTQYQLLTVAAGWTACGLTVLVQVACFNRIIGRLEEGVKNIDEKAELAHERIDKVAVHISPCPQLQELQSEIKDRLARIETKIDNLEKKKK
jgi:hypothetical protein